MDPSPKKKRYERFLLDQFLTAISLSPQEIIQGDSPDFIVNLDGRWIGIELTDIHIDQQENGSPLRKLQSISDEIVSRAQQMYEQSGASPAHVSLCFSPYAPLVRANRNQVAEVLSAFVSRLNVSTSALIEWSADDGEEEGEALSRWVSFIHVLGVPDIQMAHWLAAKAGWAAELTPSLLQNRINEKWVKLAAYQTVVEENWLVMVANATRPSQLFASPSAVGHESISSPFSRTFYYSYPRRDLIEI